MLYDQVYPTKHQLFLCLVFISLCVFQACGGGQQTYSELTQACKIQKSHPKATYLTETAQGLTLQEARDKASAELTRQLSAELKSELIVTSQNSSHSGQATQAQDQVQERVELYTHFKHAELIKAVAKCEFCQAESCQSTVALHRDQLARRLAKEINADVKRLKTSAQDLHPDSSLLRFTQAWYIAQASSQRIEPILNQLKIIERITEDLITIEALMKDAQKQRAQREENLWIGFNKLDISFKGQERLPQAIQEGLMGRFSQALETMGLKKWTQESCPSHKNGQDVIMLTPTGTLSCSLGFIGPQCKLQLGIKLNLCHKGKLGEDSWSRLKLVGVHPHETQGALDKLLKSIKSTDLSAPLSKSLSPFIIL